MKQFSTPHAQFKQYSESAHRQFELLSSNGKADTEKTLITGLNMICKVFITKQYLVVLAKNLIAIKDNVSVFYSK